MKLKAALIIISLLVIRFVYNNFFLPGELVGRYQVQNLGTRPIGAEMPDRADVLDLYADGHFQSKFYGEGTYKVVCSFGGTQIDILPAGKLAPAALFTSIERRNWGTPKIMLDYDFDVYYEKIK